MINARRGCPISADVAVAAAPAGAEEFVGTWLTANGDAHIRVAKCGKAMCGTVVWLRDAIDPKTGQAAGGRQEPQREPAQPESPRHPHLRDGRGQHRLLDRRHLQLRRRPDLQGQAFAARRQASSKCRAAPARCAAPKSGPGSSSPQNRKYRCAIGSTSAGAQVSSSPSARDLVGFRIDLDVGRGAVVHHALLGNVAGVLDRDELLLDAELVAQARPSPRPSTRTPAMTRSAPCRRRRTSAGSAPAAASGSRRWDRPSGAATIEPPLMMHLGLHAEERRRPQHQIGELALLDRADVLATRHARSPD